jgi:hypothetical protein
VARNRAFNLIHYASSQKFDIFPGLDNPESSSLSGSSPNCAFPTAAF